MQELIAYMIPIWKDRADRASELASFAFRFHRGMYDEMAYLTVQLASKMINANFVEDIYPMLPRISESFRRHWVKTPYGAEIYFSLLRMKIFYQFHPGSKELFAFFQQLGDIAIVRNEPLNNLELLGSILARTTDEREKFLLLCFHYLVLAEGIFDQAIRVLYLLGSFYHGTPRRLPNARALSLLPSKEKSNKKKEKAKSLREALSEFIGEDETRILFAGYNANLRNSIAHLDFEYDVHARITKFQDHTPRKGLVSSEPLSLSIGELASLCGKLSDVHNFVTDLLAHLRIHDLVLKEYITTMP